MADKANEQQSKPKNELHRIAIAIETGTKHLKLHIQDIPEIREQLAKAQGQLADALYQIVKFAQAAKNVYEDGHAIFINRDTIAHISDEFPQSAKEHIEHAHAANSKRGAQE